MYKENYAKTMCYGWEKLFMSYKKEYDNSTDDDQRVHWEVRMNHAAQRITEWFCKIPMYE